MELNEKGKRKDGKRGRGRTLNCKTLKDAYIQYEELGEKKEFPTVDKSTYTKVCKDFNKRLINLIIDQSQEIELPFRLGKLVVVKKEKDFNKIKKNKLPVNWKRTKELGHIVYHLEDTIYKFSWIKSTKPTSRIKRNYWFQGCRTAVRKIAENVKVKKLDYFER